MIESPEEIIILTPVQMHRIHYYIYGLILKQNKSKAYSWFTNGIVKHVLNDRAALPVHHRFMHNTCTGPQHCTSIDLEYVLYRVNIREKREGRLL